MPHKSVVLSISLVAFMTGVFLRSFFVIEKYWLFSLPVAIIFIFIKNKKWFFLTLIMEISLVAGIFYYIYRQPVVNSGRIEYYNENQINIAGRVIGDPEIKKDHQKIVIGKIYLLDDSGRSKKLSGKLLIKADLYPKYDYGNIVEISCHIKEPGQIEDFDYGKYLSLSGIYSVCYHPKIKKLDNNDSDRFSFLAAVYKTKKVIVAKTNRLFNEPQASFLSGLLIGARHGIPDYLIESFNRTGVTHIIAISGYNITIIATITLSIFQRVINRTKAFWIVVFVLLIFVIITGAPASVTRAAIMGLVVLLARQAGRLSRVGHVIILAGFIMVLINPLVLAYDAGFQLSFLATIGLIYISSKIKPFFYWVTEKHCLNESLVSTLAATLMTLPLILFQFNRLSLVSPLVNILVLPLIPLIMATGFVAVCAGFISVNLGQLIALIAWLLMEYVIKIIQLFSQIKFASMEVYSFPVIFIPFSYLIIFCFIYRPAQLLYKKKTVCQKK